MKKAKAEQVNEQEQQGGAQSNGTQGQADQQDNAANADEISAAGDGVEVSTGKQPDNDPDGYANDDDGDYARLIYREYPSMRDMFAMAALQGMLSNGTHQLRPDAVAYKAYEYADAMLAVQGE